MTVTATPIFPQTITNEVVNISNSTSTNLVTAYTGGTNGSKIEMWNIASTDTAARYLQIWFTISATSYLLGTIAIPLTSGDSSTGVVPSVNVLGNQYLPGLPRDSNGNPYLYIASGTTLQISVITAVTSGKTITSIIHGGDF